jgi:hypothetical protein
MTAKYLHVYFLGGDWLGRCIVDEIISGKLIAMITDSAGEEIRDAVITWSAAVNDQLGASARAQIALERRGMTGDELVEALLSLAPEDRRKPVTFRESFTAGGMQIIIGVDSAGETVDLIGRNIDESRD